MLSMLRQFGDIIFSHASLAHVLRGFGDMRHHMRVHRCVHVWVGVLVNASAHMHRCTEQRTAKHVTLQRHGLLMPKSS